MLTTLIGIQALCVIASGYMTYKSTTKNVKIKLVSKNKDEFKHFKAGGF